MASVGEPGSSWRSYLRSWRTIGQLRERRHCTEPLDKPLQRRHATGHHGRERPGAREGARYKWCSYAAAVEEHEQDRRYHYGGHRSSLMPTSSRYARR